MNRLFAVAAVGALTLASTVVIQGGALPGGQSTALAMQRCPVDTDGDGRPDKFVFKAQCDVTEPPTGPDGDPLPPNRTETESRTKRGSCTGPGGEEIPDAEEEQACYDSQQPCVIGATQDNFWSLWQREIRYENHEVASTGPWEYVRYGCGEEEQPPSAEDIAAKLVVLLPKVKPDIQPTARTLVNFDTIFYVELEENPIRRSLGDMNGFDIDAVARPVSYTWDFGDGESETTDSPGAKHGEPGWQDVLHQYAELGDFNATVDITYEAEYRVDNGEWQQIPETVTVEEGPDEPISVLESVPGLSSGD